MERRGRSSRWGVAGVLGGGSDSGSSAGAVSGVVPGRTMRTIDLMPSPIGDRENCRDSVDRPTPPNVDGPQSTVEVPSTPPVLTPGAARALVRVLLKASRSCSDATVPDDGEADVLAS